MLNKRRLTEILAYAPRGELLAAASDMVGDDEVAVIRPPEKTLVMLRVREPVKRSLFYLGETVATHCSVRVGKTMGCAVILGDDALRARAVAVLDAAHTADLPAFRQLLPRLECWEAARRTAQGREAARHRKTQVQFQILEDRAQ